MDTTDTGQDRMLVDDYFSSTCSNRGVSNDGRIHELAVPTSTDETSFDIIAVHNLMGNWESSWSGPRVQGSSGRLFWLRDVLPGTLPSCRIISYDCATLSRDLSERDIDGIRLDLMNNRHNCNRSRMPIIFLAAGWGGTFVKELFVSSSPQRNQRSEIRQFHACIRGFAFFSTPQGAQVLPQKLQTWQSFLKLYSMGLSSRVKDVNTIIKLTPSINYDFRSLWGESVPSVCFYDTVNLRGLGQPLAGISIATMASSFSEKVPLDLEGFEITKFSSRDDPNLTRVLSNLRRLFERAQQPTIQRDPGHRNERTQDGQRALCILSLDGGGVRGLYTIVVLEKIMEEVYHLEGGTGSTPKPCEVFDLIAGTSTGGLLAIMLGRLRMDLASCKQAYRNLSKTIFCRSGFNLPGKQWADAVRGRAWFSGEALQAAIRQVVRDRISPTERTHHREAGIDPSEAPLLDPSDSSTKCFICAIVNASHECVRLRTYTSNSGADDLLYKIWEACRATSAAPLYFPPMDIHGQRYYDGGMQSNNPILEAVEETYLLYGADAPIRAIVSIGTGKSQSQEPSGSVFGVMKSLAARTTNTEAKHEEFLRRYENLHSIYFRLQESDALGKINLAASDKLDEIERLAEEYLISEQGRDLVSRCAWSLHRSPQSG